MGYFASYVGYLFLTDKTREKAVELSSGPRSIVVYSFKNAITNTFKESDQVKLSYRVYILYRFLDN